jgi:hypothetical protein
MTDPKTVFLIDSLDVERKARRLRAEWLRSIMSRRRG